MPFFSTQDGDFVARYCTQDVEYLIVKNERALCAFDCANRRQNICPKLVQRRKILA
jgi:hypothetical protein